MTHDPGDAGSSPLRFVPRFSRSDAHCSISCDDKCFHPAPNQGGATTFTEILNRRISRRSIIRTAIAGALLALSTTPLGSRLLGTADFAVSKVEAAPSLVGVTSIPHDSTDGISLSPGYGFNVLLRWGDPIISGAPAFSLESQTAAAQARQFGFNCDFIGFVPLVPGQSTNGLLAVNHEYTSGTEMFPDYDPAAPTAEQVPIEWAAHGMSIVQVMRDSAGTWSFTRNSSFNRRITGPRRWS